MVAIGGVQGIVWVVLGGGIERIGKAATIRQINRITGIIAVGRVEGIVGRVGPCGVQRAVWCIATGRIEDVVVALSASAIFFHPSEVSSDK